VAADAARQNALWAPGLSKGFARNSSEVPHVANLHDRYLAAIGNEVTARVPTGRRSGFANSVVRLSHFPILVITPNDEEIAVIRAHPHTASATEEGVSYPSLVGAGIISNFEPSRNIGNAGQNQIIAILDTTFQVNHPMLNGKIVNAPNSPSEACFSSGTGPGPLQYFSLCPNGGPQQLGAGASGNINACAASADAVGCSNHGTHVASIAAGALVEVAFPNPISTSGLSYTFRFSGVARNARLLTVTSASRDSLGVEVGHLHGDILAALNWVYLQRLNGRNVVSVNMSFGSGNWTTYCDSSFPAHASVVQALNDVGVIAVASTGNNSYNGGISFPSCLSQVLSVANSARADNGLYATSNRSPLAKIAAMGEGITAANSGSQYGAGTGTSMAAPQVAGAIAVLRSNYSATNIEIRTALLKGTPKSFGYSGPDPYQFCGSVWLACTMPRLDVGYANYNFYALTFGGGY
jgi:subtilisin